VYIVLRRLILKFTLMCALAKEYFLRPILASKKTILEISLIVLSSLKRMLLLILDAINSLLSSFK
jgi:hypothetical protein